ncbi:MAG: polyphosphate polymerase domain-containing protein [Nitrospina sp.]|nr:polyphosphate polymerase domain-containing protein [Nitrospina sp.]
MKKEMIHRFERKFMVEGVPAWEVRGWVQRHWAIFCRQYDARWINNVYLDTPELSHYRENIEGIGERLKVRLRWYGEPGRVQKAALELKSKTGFVIHKETRPLENVPPVGDASWYGPAFARWLHSQPEVWQPALDGVQPVLVNRYRREYFISADGQFRLTLDTDLHYFPVSGQPSAGKTTAYSQRGTIVELKYALDQDDAAQHITSCFPFRLTRSSKYVMGVNRLFA